MKDSSNLAQVLVQEEDIVSEKTRSMNDETNVAELGAKKKGSSSAVKKVSKAKAEGGDKSVMPEAEQSTVSPGTDAVSEDFVANKTPAQTVKPQTREQVKQKPKQIKRKRPSRQEVIERQAHPKSKFSGKQKTFNIALEYRSDILHEYLQMNQATMLSAYERLAALLRMVAGDKDHYHHVSEWITQNVTICDEQVKELAAQREAIMEDTGVEEFGLSINVPDSYNTSFEASHPIAHKMLAILKIVDAELNLSEEMFLAGVVDDESYVKLRNQATTIVRGSVDRIFKSTTPGVREGGRYSPQHLAQWIREGNKMMFADLPQRFEHLVK